MSYTLTVIHPPTDGAAYGKAVTLDHVTDLAAVHRRVVYVLASEPNVPGSEAEDFGLFVLGADMGTDATHRPSGLTFRIDPADNAPHPCPCGEDDPDPCGRLVLPGDHAFAADPDSFCLGCWGDTVNEGCLPENTAHPIEDI